MGTTKENTRECGLIADANCQWGTCKNFEVLVEVPNETSKNKVGGLIETYQEDFEE